MGVRLIGAALLAVVLSAAAGCGEAPPTITASTAGQPPRTAPLPDLPPHDISIMFGGNSQTYYNNLPGTVARMMEFRHPEKKVVTNTISVPFLEFAHQVRECREEIESG